MEVSLKEYNAFGSLRAIQPTNKSEFDDGIVDLDDDGLCGFINVENPFFYDAWVSTQDEAEKLKEWVDKKREARIRDSKAHSEVTGLGKS